MPLGAKKLVIHFNTTSQMLRKFPPPCKTIVNRYSSEKCIVYQMKHGHSTRKKKGSPPNFQKHPLKNP